MTLQSFCTGLVIVCVLVLVVAQVWVYVAEYTRCKRANLLWSAFCQDQGWTFTAYTISWWHGHRFPSIQGNWRDRKFTMSAEGAHLVEIAGVKGGSESFFFMPNALFKKPKGRRDSWYVDSAYADGRYAVMSTSRKLAESILGQGRLAHQMQQVIDQGCYEVGLDDGCAYAADLKWFYLDQATIPQVLDLLCDLADAAERAASGPVEKLPTGKDA